MPTRSTSHFGHQGLPFGSKELFPTCQSKQPCPTSPFDRGHGRSLGSGVRMSQPNPPPEQNQEYQRAEANSQVAPPGSRFRLMPHFISSVARRMLASILLLVISGSHSNCKHRRAPDCSRQLLLSRVIGCSARQEGANVDEHALVSHRIRTSTADSPKRRYAMTAPGRWLRKCVLLVGCSLASLHRPAALPATENLQAGEQPPQVGETDPGYAKWSGATKYNKSWIAIDWSRAQGPARGRPEDRSTGGVLDSTPPSITRRRRSCSKARTPRAQGRSGQAGELRKTPSISITAISPRRSSPAAVDSCFRSPFPAHPRRTTCCCWLYSTIAEATDGHGTCARAAGSGLGWILRAGDRASGQPVYIRPARPRRGRLKNVN